MSRHKLNSFELICTSNYLEYTPKDFIEIINFDITA